LGDPWGVAADARGIVYIVDGVRVRKVDPAGTITTIAGTGTQGFSGDGGPAVKAQLGGVHDVVADREGNVYIDTNIRVRKVSRDGIITTLAGTGKPGFSGVGGPAAKARLYAPSDVELDDADNLYISDGYRVLEVGNAPLPAAAPRLQLAGRSPQRLLAQQGVNVIAGCDRPSSIAANGSVKILGTRYEFPLKPASAKLPAAGSTKLTLAFPAAEQKRFDQLLKRGQRAQATITVRAVDGAGRTCASTRVIAVRR
jgi:hypothetical protein